MSTEPAAVIIVPGRRSRFRASIVWIGFGAVLLTWSLLFRPQSLGGPADYVMVAGTSMLPTARDGDLVVVRKQSAYRKGDIIAFRVPQREPGAGQRVIHRIVGGSAAAGYVVQGDNKKVPDEWRPQPRDIVGKKWFAIPRAGKVLWLLRSPLLLASLATGLVLAFLLIGGETSRQRELN